MSDPERWLEDASVPPERKRVLGAGRAPSTLDAATRTRVGRRVAKWTLLPVSALTWLSVKSAAALGVAAGVATAGVVAVVERQITLSASRAPEAATHTPSTRGSGAARVFGPTALEAAPLEAPTVDVSAPPASAPAANPTTGNPTTLRSTPAPASSPPAGLAEESRFLEGARRVLQSDPKQALRLAREHAVRFPRGQLVAERRLLELEASYRSGEIAAARALADRLSAEDPDGLYAERIARLRRALDVP